MQPSPTQPHTLDSALNPRLQTNHYTDQQPTEYQEIPKLLTIFEIDMACKHSQSKTTSSLVGLLTSLANFLSIFLTCD